MKLIINNVEYKVSWKHLRSPKEISTGITAVSWCYINWTPLPNVPETARFLSGMARCNISDNYDRKKGMKISFERAVKQFEDVEVRRALWNAFINRGKPKTYCASVSLGIDNNKKYQIISEGKIKVNDVWVDSINYKALYPTETKIFTRAKSDFLEKFKVVI